jgi:hypothetical protein
MTIMLEPWLPLQPMEETKRNIVVTEQLEYLISLECIYLAMETIQNMFCHGTPFHLLQCMVILFNCPQ